MDVVGSCVSSSVPAKKNPEYMDLVGLCVCLYFPLFEYFLQQKMVGFAKKF